MITTVFFYLHVQKTFKQLNLILLENFKKEYLAIIAAPSANQVSIFWSKPEGISTLLACLIYTALLKASGVILN